MEKIQQKGVLRGILKRIPRKIPGYLRAVFEKSFKKFPDTSLEKDIWKLLEEVLQGDWQEFLLMPAGVPEDTPRKKNLEASQEKFLAKCLKGF